MVELEYRMHALLGVELGDLGRLTLASDSGDDVAKKADHRPPCNIDLAPRRGAQVLRRLDEGARIRVELKDRVKGAAHPARQGASERRARPHRWLVTGYR
jgi:hypothetical protein